MKGFVVCADVHAHNYAQFASPVAYYGNSRLQSIAEALLYSGDTAYELGVPLIIAGDLFHTRGTISVTVQSVIHDTLKKIGESGTKVHIVAGNHDQATKSGNITSLDTFRGVAEVYTDYACVGDYAFIPFSEHREVTIELFNRAANDGAQYVFAHAAVNGAYIDDSEYQPREQLEVSDVKPDRFKWVWLGHYHRAQLVAPNMMYCGSLVGHNFTDSDDKGFWVHLHNQEPEFVSSNSPVFVQVNLRTQAEVNKFTKRLAAEPSSYYKVKITQGLKVPTWEGNVLVEQLPSEVEFETRIQDIATLTPNQIIKAYVDSKVTDQPELLVSLGIDLAGKARY